MQKFHIITYGCSNNQAESQIMEAKLRDSGLSASDKKDADVIVVNTCSVKGKTENKILHELGMLQKSYPEKKIIVAGCLPEADLKRVRKFAPNSSIVSTNHLSKISEVALSEATMIFTGKNNEDKVGVPKIRTNKVIDIVPISSGCLSRCTFCSTKLAKGDLFSYPQEKIVDEIRNAKIGNGAREFWLTSQDNGCYGFELNTNPARLLRSITSSVSGAYFIRFGMANPQHVRLFLPELIEAYRDEHVFKFIHIPVQSGSNEVLRKMARGHTVEDYEKIVSEFRKNFPEITVWTDIIAGFPTETEEDFQKSVDLIRKTKPDVVNVSSYSTRPGTMATKMKQLPTEVKKERTRIMASVVKEIYIERNRQWLGWSGPVIIDEYNATTNSFIGRNYAYKPVVVNGEAELGQIADAEITGFTSSYLIGRLL